MPDILNAREVDAFMHPHSHKYNLLGLMNDINAKLVCDIPIHMMDIDAMAVKHELPEEQWNTPAGPRRFSFDHKPKAINTAFLDRAWPTNHDEDGQPVAVATGFGLVPLSEINTRTDNYYGDSE